MRVVLTGAGGGIGRRVGRRLFESGHDVIGLDRDKQRLEELPEGIDTRVVDLSDEAAVENCLGGTDADALVSAVGWYELAAVEDCSPDSLRAHLESNLLAVHTPVHALLSGLRDRDGHILVVGSMVGSVSLPYHGAYSAAKAGLAGYVESLRREVTRRGVDVSLIEPGPVGTGFNERAATALEGFEETDYGEEYRAFGSYSPEAVDPEQLADTIVTVLETENPRARYRISARARWLPRLQWLLPARVYDRLVRSGLPGGILHRLIDR